MNKYGYEMSVLISEEKIQSRISELATDISNEFKDEIPIEGTKANIGSSKSSFS